MDQYGASRFHDRSKVSKSPVLERYTEGSLFCLCFFWGDHGSRGWYDNPQPVLRPVLAQCATPCVCEGVCVYGWCAATAILTVRV